MICTSTRLETSFQTQTRFTLPLHRFHKFGAHSHSKATNMTGTALDPNFFERCSTTTHKGSKLEAYRAIYARSTMVLFSRKTHTPIAALTFAADDKGCLGMLTGRPAPPDASETYFQGMLNLPDQNFTFTISNLSNKGSIRFQVLHQGDGSASAQQVNQINVLRSNQTYTIPGDRRSNRKTLSRSNRKSKMFP